MRPPIDAIRARWAAATPGPWGTGGTFHEVWNADHRVAIVPSWKNLNAIANAPTDIEALLAYVGELEAKLDALARRPEKGYPRRRSANA